MSDSGEITPEQQDIIRMRGLDKVEPSAKDTGIVDYSYSESVPTGEKVRTTKSPAAVTPHVIKVTGKDIARAIEVGRAISKHAALRHVPDDKKGRPERERDDYDDEEDDDYRFDKRKEKGYDGFKKKPEKIAVRGGESNSTSNRPATKIELRAMEALLKDIRLSSQALADALRLELVISEPTWNGAGFKLNAVVRVKDQTEPVKKANLAAVDIKTVSPYLPTPKPKSALRAKSLPRLPYKKPINKRKSTKG